MAVITIAIATLGIFGAVVSLKYYERFRFHLHEASLVREKLTELLPGAALSDLSTASSQAQAQAFPKLIKVRLYTLWFLLNCAIALAGIGLTVAALL
jgi:hypothetical protein